MKYFVRVSIVLLIAVGIVFGFSYYYREKKNNENIVLTTQVITTTKPNQTTTAAPDTVYYDDNGFKLFIDNKNKAYIEYNSVRKELGGFDWALTQKPVDFYYGDYDGDNEKELLVLYCSPASDLNNSLITADKSDFENYHKYAVLIKPITNSSGKQDFKIIYADQNTWKKPFEMAINSKMNQVKSCSKYLQFVMDDNDVELKYDKATGISSNKYVYYAKALHNDNKDGYKKFTKWGKGEGNYYVAKDGSLQLNIMVLAYYDDSSKAQYVGDIHTGVSVNKKGRFTITPKTIEFIPKDSYAMPDLRDNNPKKFTYTLNNTSSNTITTNDNLIDWIDASFEIADNVNEQSVSFGELESQIKCVDKVKITQTSIVLTAKEGFVFSDRVTNSGDYSVVIGDNKDITYKAEILERESRSVLKITYDKKYSRDMLKNVKLKYGA